VQNIFPIFDSLPKKVHSLFSGSLVKVIQIEEIEVELGLLFSSFQLFKEVSVIKSEFLF